MGLALRSSGASGVIQPTEVQLGDGTVADPSLQFRNDPDTGIYRPGADQIGIAAGGVQRALVQGARPQVSILGGNAASEPIRNLLEAVDQPSADIAIGDIRALNATLMVTSAITTPVEAKGVLGRVINISGGTGKTLIGITGTVEVSGGSPPSIIGVSGSVRATNSSPTSSATAINAFVDVGTGRTIPTAFGVRVQRNVNGAITNLYGLFLDVLAGAGITNAWGIYQSGTEPNRLLGPVRHGDGTAAAPSVTFDAATGTGLYHVGAGTLGIAVNGAERLEVGAGQIGCLAPFAPSTPAGAGQSSVRLFGGTGAPNNADGNNGDIYFRSDGAALTTIYQKRAGVWVGIV